MAVGPERGSIPAGTLWGYGLPSLPAAPHKLAIVADITAVKLLSVLAILAALFSLALGGLATAQAVPLPRPRPGQISTAAPTPEGTAEEAAPSACRLRLTAELAVAPSLPALIGPRECAADDAVRLCAARVLHHLTR